MKHPRQLEDVICTFTSQPVAVGSTQLLSGPSSRLTLQATDRSLPRAASGDASERYRNRSTLAWMALDA